MGSFETIQRDMNREAARKLRELADSFERGDAGVFDWEQHHVRDSMPPLMALQVRFVTRHAPAPVVSGEHR